MPSIQYTITDIENIVSGKLITHSSLITHHSSLITRLLIDSRKLNIAEGTLFFAIKGSRHDGHTFIPDLYEKGVRNFVVSQSKGLGIGDWGLGRENANFILVE